MSLDLEPLELAVAAAGKAREAAREAAGAATAVALAAEEMSALAWAAHEAAETALIAAKGLQAFVKAAVQPPPPGPDYTTATVRERGQAAMASRRTGGGEPYTLGPVERYKNAALVAIGSASETEQATRTIVQALKDAVLVAEAAQEAATKAAEKAVAWA
jgi:hypothetical protein